MLDVSEALQAVLGRARALDPRSIPVSEALGCLLAEDATADIDLPPFEKALMDGYAVRAGDVAGNGGRLRIGEEVPAGRIPTRALGSGEAALIMTGAPLPEGADAVVMIERTSRVGECVVIDDPGLVPGRNRMRRGREARAGDVVLPRGVRLDPVKLGVLASVGKENVSVVPRPSLAVVSTGDELVEPDQVPGPGQIRNSNATMLRALAATVGAVPEVFPIVPDEPEPLLKTLGRGLAADVLLITGGVSAGNRDLVPGALESLGVERVFHKVRLKPGKPIWFGVGPTRAGGAPGTLVFGLPGNPVSGVVGFLLFVGPAIEALRGFEPVKRSFEARLSSPFEHNGDRPTYHPSRMCGVDVSGGRPMIETLSWSGSADLRTVGMADGFAVFAPGVHAYAAGEIVEFVPLGLR